MHQPARTPPARIGAEALRAASNWAFNRDTPEQVTISMLVDDGELDLDAPLDIEWLPPVSSPESASHDMVIVRRSLDWGGQGFDRWDLTREVLEAVI